MLTKSSFQLPPIVKNNRITRSAVNSSNSKSGELITKRSYCEVASSEQSSKNSR